jgi:hypothetical protein
VLFGIEGDAIHQFNVGYRHARGVGRAICHALPCHIFACTNQQVATVLLPLAIWLAHG